MSLSSEGPLKYGVSGLMGDSLSPGQKHVPTAMTSSHAAQNEAHGSSMQFNADVGRHTTATYSRDTLQIEDNRVGDGYVRAEQGHVNLHFNFAQSIPGHSQATTSKGDSSRAPFLATNNPRQISRSASGGDVLDMQPSPSSPIPSSAHSSANPDLSLPDVVQANRASVNAIETRVSEIFEMYVALPRKIRRLSRSLRVSSMHKDLNGQSAMFRVTVENGELISCLKRTIEAVPSFPQVVSASASENMEIKKIQDRLDHIHKLLVNVDNLSDELAVMQDRINLPLRPRKVSGNTNQGQQQDPISTTRSHGGVVKRRQRKMTKRKTNEPLMDLGAAISMLTAQMEALQNQCQKLQPPQHDDMMDITSIPEDLELIKAVAVMLCKALCQVCPNENHIHQILFGLATQELAFDNSGNTAVEFNLAFECPGESETSQTWFIVHSTLKAPGEVEMEVEQVETKVRPAPPHTRPSFSHYLRDSSYATGQPNARFCLQYYKQGTDDLAVALKHSDLCEHVVFYPDQARLDTHQSGQAIPLRSLLAEWCQPMQQLGILNMVHIARMLSEAVLIFHSDDCKWLSCKWDLDNILVYKIDGLLEPHLRFNLWNPESAGMLLEPTPRPQQMTYVLSQLGILLGCLAVGPNADSATYEEVRQATGSTMYAEILQTCRDMSRNEKNMGDQDMQERFHAKVVAKLGELEELLTEQLEDFHLDFQ